MKTATKIINMICTVLGYIGAACLAFMMIYTVIDVLSRTIAGKPFSGTTELMAYVFCGMLYACFSYTQINHSHIHVTVITEKLPGKAKFVLWALTSWIGAISGVIIAYATYEQTLIQIKNSSYTMMLHIPYPPLYIFCIVGMCMFAAALILDSVKATLAIFNSDYAREVADENFITKVDIV